MYKFNNGEGALVCDRCNTIVATGIFRDPNIWSCLCDNCKTFDNFDIIASLCDNLSYDYFYFCQVIKRKKDKNEIKDIEVIKSYYIRSASDLMEAKQSIIELCNKYNARAYFNLNVRNKHEVLAKCIQTYTDMLIDKIPFSPYVFDSCCGQCGKSVTFLIDVDSNMDQTIIEKLIRECQGNGKIIARIETPNGYHLITTKFDRNEFTQKLAIEQISDVCIKANSPTLLYYKMK